MSRSIDARDLIHRCQHCGIRYVVTAAEQLNVAGEPRAGLLCPTCRVLTPVAGRERGLVKWYNPRKGYGFISRAHGGELFVHRSALPALTNLQPNDLVEFAVELSPKGVQAGQVVVLTTSVSS